MLALKRSGLIAMSMRVVVNRSLVRPNSTNLLGAWAGQKMTDNRSAFLVGERISSKLFVMGSTMSFCTNPQQSPPPAGPAAQPQPTAAAGQQQQQEKPLPSPTPTPHSAGVSSSSAPPSAQPQGPAINMPDKQQIEKFVFRTLAFLWDTAVLIYAWSKKNFDKHVVENPTVQMYWKQFLTKLEKARKD